MNRRLTLGLAAVLAIGACSDAPTDTSKAPPPPDFVLFGQPDGAAHRYVGLLLFYDANGPAWFCTGSALNESTILTAGHCTSGATEAHYYPMEKPLDAFATIALFFAGGIIGTPIAHPDFGENFPDTKDVGVVKLEGVPGPYAALPPVNGLAALNKHQLFDIVGYGVEDVKPVEVFNAERMSGKAMLVNSKSGFSGGFNLQLSSNNGTPHRGGLCFGDSGGPVLVGNVIYGINSFVINPNCAGSGYSYRVDIETIREWIDDQL